MNFGWRSIFTGGFLFLLMVNGRLAIAGDVIAGKARAAMCVTCHGGLGLSQMPNTPHLAGQPVIYLVEQLKNFRSGKRQNEVMGVMAKPLTDQEIENLAEWYASIQITATAP
jgi:cytochrome c553